MNPEQYKQRYLSIMNKKLDEIEAAGYSDNVQKVMKADVKIWTYLYLMRYESEIEWAYRELNNIKNADRDKITFKPETPGMEYYSFLKDEAKDDYMASRLAGNLSVIDCFNLLPSSDVYANKYDKPAKERFAYFREKITPVLGDCNRILFDIVQATFYAQPLREKVFFTAAEKREIRDAFRDKPAYAEALIAENDKQEAIIAAGRENCVSIINELPKVSQEKMMDAILAGYKGKVVVVNFWHTLGDDYVKDINEMKPLKEEMKDRNVVWLYIADEMSPVTAWTQISRTISGEHYRTGREQANYWSKTYGVGAPSCMIYDIGGKLLSRYSYSIPGVDALKADIERGRVASYSVY
jgi:hypothetical protein